MGNDAIPIQIKTPSGADSAVRSFVVGIADLIPVGYEAVRRAEESYRTKVAEWREDVATFRTNKSDAVLRWRLGKEINRFFRTMVEKHGIAVTNQLEALSHDLGISPDSLGFIVKLPLLFTKSEIESSGLTWSKFQELLGIKSEVKMRQCFRMLRSGKIRYDWEIRAFKYASNRKA